MWGGRAPEDEGVELQYAVGRVGGRVPRRHGCRRTDRRCRDACHPAPRRDLPTLIGLLAVTGMAKHRPGPDCEHGVLIARAAKLGKFLTMREPAPSKAAACTTSSPPRAQPTFMPYRSRHCWRLHDGPALNGYRVGSSGSSQ